MRRRGKLAFRDVRVPAGLEPLEVRRLLAGISPNAILFDPVPSAFPEGEPVVLSGRFDPSPTAPLQIDVRWGDEEVSSFAVPAGSPQFALSHVYPDDQRLGVPTVEYVPRVAFSEGGETILTTRLNVRIDNVPPVLDRLDLPPKVIEGQQFTASMIASDPGNDPILGSWDFGDGSRVASGSSVSHVYRDNGNFTVTLTLTDDDLGFARYRREIIVSNANPDAMPDEAVVFARGVTPVTGNVLENDRDAAGESDPLVVTRWSGETDPDNDIAGSFGALNWEPDGSFSYLPDRSNPAVQQLRADETLKEEFQYSISDGDGGSDIANLTITIVGSVLPLEVIDNNAAENTVAENAATGAPVGITAQGNAIAGVTTTFELSDSAAGRFQIDPATGIVSVANGNALNFESRNQHPITVIARTSEGDVAFREFMVTLVDVNEPPRALPDPGHATDEDSPFIVPGFTEGGLLANDRDPERDPLTVVEFEALSEQGARVLVGPDGSFEYDPTAATALQGLTPGSQVVDTFAYTVSDGEFTATATVFIEVSGVADAPLAADDTLSVFETSEAVAVTATLLTNDSDIDAGDVLTIVSVDTSETLGTVTLEAGEVRYSPGNQFDHLHDGETATDRFLYQIRDRFGLTATARAVVTIFGIGQPQNLPPSISELSDQVIREDRSTGAISFTVDDLETEPGNLGVTAASSVPALIPPGNMILGGSGDNRTVTVVPAPNVFGEVTITLTVTDGELETSETFLLTIQPVNDAPTITAVPDQTINEDGATEPLPFTVGDHELNPDELVVTATSSDPLLVPEANIVISGDGADRTVTVVPAADRFGNASITLAVSDGEVSTARSFVLTVNPLNNETHVLDVTRNDGRQRFDELTSLAFTFDQDVSNHLTADDLSLVNATASEAVDLSPVPVVWDPEALTARWDLSSLDLVPGRYTATLKANSIQDAAGNRLDGNSDGNPGDDHHTELVVTWQGDTDRDLDVDFVDFTQFAFGFGQAGTWARGDFDASGAVDFADFLLLSLNLGKRLSAPPSPASIDAALAAIAREMD